MLRCRGLMSFLFCVFFLGFFLEVPQDNAGWFVVNTMNKWKILPILHTVNSGQWSVQTRQRRNWRWTPNWFHTWIRKNVLHSWNDVNFFGENNCASDMRRNTWVINRYLSTGMKINITIYTRVNGLIRNLSGNKEVVEDAQEMLQTLYSVGI